MLYGIEDFNKIFLKAKKKSGIEVEIGCGNGHFIVNYCRNNRESYLFGIDRKKSRCLKAVRKVERNKLSNAAIIYGRAEEIIGKIPLNSIDGFHIYFPDPWPKTKHRRRRLVKMLYIDMLFQRLKIDGKIYFSSDILDYCLQTKILLILHPHFNLINHNPFDEVFDSVFANKFQSQGKAIHFTCAKKIRINE